MKKFLLAGVSLTALGFTGAANAGNIVLTGHDNDFHQSVAAKAAMSGAITFIRNGSALPLLTFDSGSELTSLLTSMGFVSGTDFFNVSPSAAIDPLLFDHSKFSAFIVASVTSCGGCDNSPASIDNIVAQSAAIATFFNDGGGIMGLAGALDPGAYDYVPAAATNAGGSPPSTGYVTTAQGVVVGIPAVNGDTTHNFFSEPGTGGLSPLFFVTERLGDPVTGIPETVALKGGTIVCTGAACTITGTVPEPSSLLLLGTGMFALATRRRWGRRLFKAR